MARSRSRRKHRDNPLSTAEVATAAVASVVILGSLTWILVAKSSTPSTPSTPNASPALPTPTPGPGGASCWQPVPIAFTMVPGHYRIEYPIPATQLGSMQSQWSQLASQIATLQQQLKGFTIQGAWAGGLAYPSGTPFPTDWPDIPPSTSLCVDFLCAYNMTGTQFAATTLPNGMQVWSCSTGPVPAQMVVPANIASLLTQLATIAGDQ
jgi:hypothetical protein